MVITKTKEIIESRCGIKCSACKFKLDGVCIGCLNIKKPFWADACPIKNCCEEKKLACCGECKIFPCNALKSFSYDKEQGDNGLRIENCKKWCPTKEKEKEK